MSRKLILPLKDGNGIYLPPQKQEDLKDEVPLASLPLAAMDKEPAVSIDNLKRRGLNTINLVMKNIYAEALGIISRESMQNLKDCMSILKDLKAEEKDIIEDLSTEELEAIAKNDNQS